MTAPTETEPITYTIERPQNDEVGTDPEHTTHIVDQRPGSGQDVATAMIEGTEVVALCGHRFIPYRDPKYPICKPCLEEVARLSGGGA